VPDDLLLVQARAAKLQPWPQSADLDGMRRDLHAHRAEWPTLASVVRALLRGR
jgi:hypothetical protein